jgi:hypothetical protein
MEFNPNFTYILSMLCICLCVCAPAWNKFSNCLKPVLIILLKVHGV